MLKSALCDVFVQLTERDEKIYFMQFHLDIILICRIFPGIIVAAGLLKLVRSISDSYSTGCVWCWEKKPNYAAKDNTHQHWRALMKLVCEAIDVEIWMYRRFFFFTPWMYKHKETTPSISQSFRCMCCLIFIGIKEGLVWICEDAKLKRTTKSKLHEIQLWPLRWSWN